MSGCALKLCIGLVLFFYLNVQLAFKAVNVVDVIPIYNVSSNDIMYADSMERPVAASIYETRCSIEFK